MPAIDACYIFFTPLTDLVCKADGTGGVARFKVRSTSSSGNEPYLAVTIYNSRDEEVYANSASAFEHTFETLPLADGVYRIEAVDGDDHVAPAKPFTVNCGVTSIEACTIAVSVVSTTSPTSANGFGGALFRIVGAKTSAITLAVKTAAGVVVTSYQVSSDGDYSSLVGLVAGAYTVTVAEGTGGGCTAAKEFTVDPFVEPAPAPENDPVEWFAVGGVLPNPAYLSCRVSGLTYEDADGITRGRRGLHLEVELFRVGAAEAFARVRKTVRAVLEQVDVARYLRPELLAELRYAPRTIALDADAVLAFTYRYREVDAEGFSSWVQRATPRYAYLAALPGALDPAKEFVADPQLPARPLSSFAELTHFVGFPLEVSLLVPPNRATDLYLEHRYLDARGAEIAVASWKLNAGAAGGMVRLPHVDAALPCAVSAETALVDADRAYAGTCPDGSVIAPPAVENGFLQVGPGRLRLR